jgi:hypothetical protein
MTHHDEETVETIRALAALEFEPWLPGQEEEMTPASLTEAANSGPFIYAFFAYKSMFKPKSEMVEACRRSTELSEDLVANISGAATWFESLASMMREAAERHMSAIATVDLEHDLAEAA